MGNFCEVIGRFGQGIVTYSTGHKTVVVLLVITIEPGDHLFFYIYFNLFIFSVLAVRHGGNVNQYMKQCASCSARSGMSSVTGRLVTA